MSPSSLREQMLQRTSESLGRLGRSRARCEARRGEPPRPGDLFVFRERAETGVQWAVLDRDPADRRRFYVVPADTDPRAEAGDVAVPSDALCGALTLRVRFGVWLGEDAFDPDLRTGELDAEDLERARRTRLELG